MTSKKQLTGSLVLAVAVAISLFLFLQKTNTANVSQESAEVNTSSDTIPTRLSSSGLTTDFTKTSINLQKVLSGGPGKDGIPALTNPKFEPLSESNVAGETQVIVVENNGEVKIYPYSILVWHEIVNDAVGGKPLAVTFCPLCGSSIVFEREVDGQVIDFGVSGFLYESNMIMYSREDSESLYSQSLGEAVIGERVSEKLEHFPLRLMSYADAKSQLPEAIVLSDDTGFSRDYSSNPYGDYDMNEQLFFQVSNTDQRFPAKEVFYIVPLEGMSIAVQQGRQDGVYDVPDSDIKITYDKGRITANWGNVELPGYFEMWFSWATHNQETGIVLAK